MSRNAIITVIVILLIIGGIWWWAGNRNDIDINNDQNGTTTAGLRVGDSTLFVTDQEPGEDLNLNSIVLREGGYVAIHQDANGAPGNIIGTTEFLPEGEHENIDISLDREVGAGETLYAMIHTDDGDQVFNADQDDPLMDNGAPVMVSFMIIDEELGEFDVKL